MAYDGDLSTYFDSGYLLRQMIQIDFNTIVGFSGFRRYMTRDGSDATGYRGSRGEEIWYSLDGVNWKKLRVDVVVFPESVAGIGIYAQLSLHLLPLFYTFGQRDVSGVTGKVVSVVVFITVFKTVLNVILLGLLGETWPRAFQTGVLLAQIGEFSFILVALGLSVGSVSPETYRLIVAVTALSLMISPFWLLTARRLHRIALTGVTSPRELLRLTFGREAAVVFRTTRLAEHRMIDMAGGATRWVGDIMPRRNRPPGEPGPDVTPGLGPQVPDGRKRGKP